MDLDLSGLPKPLHWSTVDCRSPVSACADLGIWAKRGCVREQRVLRRKNLCPIHRIPYAGHLALTDLVHSEPSCVTAPF